MWAGRNCARGRLVARFTALDKKSRRAVAAASPPCASSSFSSGSSSLPLDPPPPPPPPFATASAPPLPEPAAARRSSKLAAACHSPASMLASFATYFWTSSARRRRQWHFSHPKLSTRCSAAKSRGWYTGTHSSTWPQWPRQCRASSPHVGHSGAPESIGPIRSSYSPWLMGWPNVSSDRDWSTRTADAFRTSSAVRNPNVHSLTMCRMIGASSRERGPMVGVSGAACAACGLVSGAAWQAAVGEVVGRQVV